MLYIVRGFALFNRGRFGNYTRDGGFPPVAWAMARLASWPPAGKSVRPVICYQMRTPASTAGCCSAVCMKWKFTTLPLKAKADSSFVSASSIFSWIESCMYEILF